MCGGLEDEEVRNTQSAIRNTRYAMRQGAAEGRDGEWAVGSRGTTEVQGLRGSPVAATEGVAHAASGTEHDEDE